MKITVKLIGPFVQLFGFGEKEMEVAPATTIDGLLGLIAFDKARPKIITRNGLAVGPEETVENGDRIAISPIYSGG